MDEYGQELKWLFQRAYPKMAREESREGKNVMASRFVAGLRREIQEKLAGSEEEFEALLQRACFEEAKRKEIWRESERGKGSESRASARFGAGADRSDPADKERHTEGGSRNQP